MGFRVLRLFSLLIFVYLINFASSYPIRKTLPSEFVQKSELEDKEIYGSKMEGGATHGGTHGGQSHGNGNGNSAGGAVIPIYAAGAAKNRQHQSHRGAANCNLNKIKFSSMLVMTFVHPLILLFLLI